jgi:hypothetical protein
MHSTGKEGKLGNCMHRMMHWDDLASRSQQDVKALGNQMSFFGIIFGDPIIGFEHDRSSKAEGWFWGWGCHPPSHAAGSPAPVAAPPGWHQPLEARWAALPRLLRRRQVRVRSETAPEQSDDQDHGRIHHS